jgi:hypothetical protein
MTLSKSGRGKSWHTHLNCQPLRLAKRLANFYFFFSKYRSNQPEKASNSPSSGLPQP